MKNAHIMFVMSLLRVHGVGMAVAPPCDECVVNAQMTTASNSDYAAPTSME